MGEGHRHPNSLAALIPFTKNDPRRRSGSPAFSRRVLACLNVLADTDEDGRAVYDLPTLKAISDDGQVDHARGVAAAILAHVREIGWDKICRQPKSLSMLSWLFDRQLGKPHVTATIEHKVTRSATEVVRDLSGLLSKSHMMRSVLTEAVRQNPELADMLREIAAQAPVETKAVELPAGSESWNGNDLVIRQLK